MTDKICESCAGKYNEMLSECPYCGSVNYVGAEAAYFDRLEEVREDMEDLKQVPAEEIKEEFGKQGRFLGKVFVIIALVFLVFIFLYLLVQVDWDSDRDQKADYLWKQENYPLMDQLYENGDYEALREYFTEENKVLVSEWSHCDFFNLYVDIAELFEMYSREREDGELDSYDYVLLLDKEWTVLHSYEIENLDEQEQERLAQNMQAVQESFDTRWKMTAADYEMICQQVEENNGWISLEICENYVGKWLESK